MKINNLPWTNETVLFSAMSTGLTIYNWTTWAEYYMLSGVSSYLFTLVSKLYPKFSDTASNFSIYKLSTTRICDHYLEHDGCAISSFSSRLKMNRSCSKNTVRVMSCWLENSSDPFVKESFRLMNCFKWSDSKERLKNKTLFTIAS